MSFNDTADLFGTADTISECEDAEFLSAAEAVKKLEEVNNLTRISLDNVLIKLITVWANFGVDQWQFVGTF